MSIPTRTALQRGRVVGQFDRKFIIVSTPAPGGTDVFILDQHAAHERLRLEAMRRFPPEAFVRPRGSLRVLLPHTLSDDTIAAEASLFRWGWRFSSEASQRWMIAAPCVEIEGIDRLCSGIDELGEAMTSDAQNPAAGPLLLSACDPDSWPPCIHDALILRSCRGALMFGDRLSSSVAAAITMRLSVAEQFDVCSHGRPSISAAAFVATGSSYTPLFFP